MTVGPHQLLIGLALSALMACAAPATSGATAGAGDSDTILSDASADTGRADTAGAGGSQGDSADGAAADAGRGGSDAGAHQLSIVFDYSMDKHGFFADPKRRAVLEAAAATWSSRIRDDFATVPAGTLVRVRDPSEPGEPSLKFALESDVDDLRIWVGCATEGVKLGKAHIAYTWQSSTPLGKALKARYEGDDYEPWVAAITFNCDKPWFFDPTPDDDSDLPKKSNDFLSTARHEIGHCLGLIGSAAARAYVQGEGTDTPSFHGPAAVQAHGGPVPLEPDARHVKNGLLSGGTEVRMDPSTKTGTRKWPTPVDWGMLADIGYELTD